MMRFWVENCLQLGINGFDQKNIKLIEVNITLCQII